MHPDNIYKTPPNFKELAINYPDFRKFVKQELSGRLKIDYSDPNAVKALTSTLLKKDFNLDVSIDETRLIPRVPLCLNYLLWVKDLINVLKLDDVPIGVDIGTGNVCIYSLLAAKMGWKMLATEVDKQNFKSASNNVVKNNLNNAITVKLVDNSNQIIKGVLDENKEFDFCMCNPPFFDYFEKPQNRTSRRRLIQSVASFDPIEISTSGGELSFVKQLIKESSEIKHQIKIYTSLIGKKCDYLALKKELLKVSPKSFLFTEFCQGKTIRWGMAWTFLDVSLNKLGAKSAKRKKIKPILEFPIMVSNSTSFDLVYDDIKKKLTALEINFREESSGLGRTLSFKAYKNTWSHQRRKKRENARSKIKSKEIQSIEKEENFLDINDSACLDSKRIKVELIKDSSVINSVVVEGVIVINSVKSIVTFEMSYLSGSKECLHQIFQYFKNHFSKDNFLSANINSDLSQST